MAADATFKAFLFGIAIDPAGYKREGDTFTMIFLGYPERIQVGRTQILTALIRFPLVINGTGSKNDIILPAMQIPV
jgi:hypothetical protein